MITITTQKITSNRFDVYKSVGVGAVECIGDFSRWSGNMEWKFNPIMFQYNSGWPLEQVKALAMMFEKIVAETPGDDSSD